MRCRSGRGSIGKGVDFVGHAFLGGESIGRSGRGGGGRCVLLHSTFVERAVRFRMRWKSRPIYVECARSISVLARRTGVIWGVSIDMYHCLSTTTNLPPQPPCLQKKHDYRSEHTMHNQPNHEPHKRLQPYSKTQTRSSTHTEKALLPSTNPS